MPRFAPCYRREDYALVREILHDGEALPLAFDEWEKNAESEGTTAKRDGVNIIPVFIKPDEFFSFCQEKKIAPNRANATAFASSRGVASYGSMGCADRHPEH